MAINLSNIKDWLNTLCGIIIALTAGGSGFLWTLGITFPTWVYSVAALLFGLATFARGYLGGKNPNGTTKTQRQVDNINNEAAATKEIK
jgi:hypothetical protein